MRVHQGQGTLRMFRAWVIGCGVLGVRELGLRVHGVGGFNIEFRAYSSQGLWYRVDRDRA